MNTNMHLTEQQARTMLAAVRFTALMRVTIDGLEALTGRTNALPELHKLKGAETMLIAAIERIRDKERTR